MFPEDVVQAECVLAELGINSVVSISPAEVPKLPHAISHLHVTTTADELLSRLPELCVMIQEAVEKSKVVLVYSENECRACIITCAYCESLSLLYALHETFFDDCF